MLKQLSFFTLILSLIYFEVNAINDENKVSIIIPIYNTEPYIKQCLDSVINQTYKNLEIICIDDCGNDNSIKITEKYKQKDKRIRIIYNKTNKGAGVSRNIGVKNSTGVYIFFVDSDDYIDLDIIEKLIRKQKEKNYDIVMSNTKVFSSDSGDPLLNKRVYEKQKYFDYCSRTNINQVSKKNFQKCLSCIPASPWGKLYKTHFLISNDIWHIDQNTPYEDDGFNVKILSSFPLISTVHDTNVYYRMRHFSVIDTNDSNLKQKNLTIRKVLNDAFLYIKKHTNQGTADNLIKLTKTSNTYFNFYAKELSIAETILFFIKKLTRIDL